VTSEAITAMPHKESRRGAYLPSSGREPVVGLTTEVCICNAWSVRRQPAVTFPAAGHHRLLTGTKLYCLVTEAFEA